MGAADKAKNGSEEFRARAKQSRTDLERRVEQARTPQSRPTEVPKDATLPPPESGYGGAATLMCMATLAVAACVAVKEIHNTQQ